MSCLIHSCILVSQAINDRYSENMATLRISEDQENRGINLRQTQKELSHQQRRPVLGVINKNTTRVPSQKSKQVS